MLVESLLLHSSGRAMGSIRSQKLRCRWYYSSMVTTQAGSLPASSHREMHRSSCTWMRSDRALFILVSSHQLSHSAHIASCQSTAMVIISWAERRGSVL